MTDLAARGIDIPLLENVIHYDFPPSLKLFIHRSGRTGRANKKGESIIISTNRDSKKIKLIEKMINKKIDLSEIPSGEMICEKQLLIIQVVCQHKLKN